MPLPVVLLMAVPQRVATLVTVDRQEALVAMVVPRQAVCPHKHVSFTIFR